MNDVFRKVDYFYIKAANKSGEGAKVLRALRDEGINLLAFSGFPQGQRAQIDFIPEDPAMFEAAAKRIGLKPSKKKSGFLVQGQDRPGAVAEIMGRLADAKINVTAIDAISAGESRYGAILWVKPKDVEKAARALGASS
ncbi:MAG TPA: ACT domain-containing protein [Nitrospiria bacterium]|nr:ACT domain-containing protein [Nitrospiria bacterium]